MQDSPPTVVLIDGGSLKDVGKPSIRPLLACNLNAAGKPIMPAGTRLQLPSYDYEDAATLNKRLGDMIVVAFGGTHQRDYQPDSPEEFESMQVTHVCRLR